MMARRPWPNLFAKPLILPALIALFPVLALYRHNYNELEPVELVLPIALILVVVPPVWFLAGGLFRSQEKGALWLGLLLLAFFSYNAIKMFLDGIVPGESGFDDRNLLGILLALLIGVTFALVRIRTLPREAIRAANFAAIGLVAFLATSVIVLEAPQASFARPHGVSPDAGSGHLLPYRPDVYWIVLDGYANPHVLRETYNFDNAWFAGELRVLGFQILENSSANYPITDLSLPSAMMMDYIQPTPEMLAAPKDPRPLKAFAHGNNVSRFLENQGYTYYFLHGRHWPRVEGDLGSREIVCGRMTEFQTAMIAGTPMPALWPNLLLDDGQARIRCTLDALPFFAGQGPRFVFTHLLAPHPPFVFGERGESIPSDYVAQGNDPRSEAERVQIKALYVAQLKYTNSLVLEALTRIIENATNPPIIVLQSDHGPASLAGFHPNAPNEPPEGWAHPSPEFLQERMPIFHAILMPGTPAPVYHNMTPVNTFRILFNHYFGANLPLKPDINNYVTYGPLYEYENATSIVQARFNGR